MTPSSRLRLLLGTCCASLILACGGGDAPPVAPPTPPPPAPTAVTLAPNSLTFEAIGRTGTLTASLAPAGATGTVVWRSANPAIASVSGTGATATVTAIAPGTTQILAAVGSIEGSATVTVPPVPQSVERTIPATGGTITLDVPGHPFEGLALHIPSGSFDGTTTWRVSTDSSPPPAFRSGATVLGPGLAIQGVSGQTRGGQLLTLRVPIPAPTQSNSVVVIALVDPVTGDFDLLPLVDRDSTSVTVMTRHLDARLFRPNTQTASPRNATAASGFSWQHSPDEPSQLYRVQLSTEELRSILATLDPARHAWPVAEDGSAKFPRGHGSAISALQVAAAVRDIDLRVFVRQHADGTYYADTAAFATLMLMSARQQYNELVLRMVRQIGRSMSASTGMSAMRVPLPKAVRDTLTAINIAAGMALTRRPQLFLKLPAGSDPEDRGHHAWGTAVSTDASGNVRFLSPAANQAGSLFTLTLGDNGFSEIESKSLASDAAPTPREDIMAVTRALMDISAADMMLATLERAILAEATQRQAQNRALWSATNSRVLDVEVRRTSAAEFVKVDGPLTVFDTAATIRLAGSEPAQLMLRFFDPGSGAEVMSASGAEDVAIERLPRVRGAPEGESVTVEGVIVDNATGRQVVPVRFDVIRGSFVMEEDTVELNEDASVEVTAVLKPTPAEGFVVHWDWGDGTSSEVAGLTSATHTYDESGDYTVVATLRGPSDTVALAKDTAEVIEAPGAWIGTVSGQSISEHSGGTTFFDATNVRWEPNPGYQTDPGWVAFRIVSGQLRYWRDVPCANWTGPVYQVDLSTGTFNTNFLLISKSGAQVPGGGTSPRWYRGQSVHGSGPRMTNKTCISIVNPDPQEYVFSGPPIFFQTAHISGFAPRAAANRNVLEGTYSQNSGGLASTWTWRFERVP